MQSGWRFSLWLCGAVAGFGVVGGVIVVAGFVALRLLMWAVRLGEWAGW